jgi:hypothetical protein
MFDALWTSQALEAAMLVCFGVAWPLNLLLMLRHRRPEGKGMPFTVVIASGYVCGATAKVLLHLNALSVAANVAVQIHFRRQPRCPGTPLPGPGRLERLAP